MLGCFGGNGDGGKTAAFGTAIQYLIPPHASGRTRITKLVYTSAGTAHTLTLLRPLGRTVIGAIAAAGQPVCVLSTDPSPAGNTLTTNDFVAIRTASDDVTLLYKVSGLATLTLTLTANLTTALAAGDDLWMFGVPADIFARTGGGHMALLPAVSVTTTYSDSDGGVVATYNRDEPILFNSDNGTAAGTLAQIAWAYTAY